MSTSRKFFLSLIVALVVLLVGAVLYALAPYERTLDTQPLSTIELTYNDTVYSLNPETVTGENLNLGLMNRPMPPSQGMLFDFENADSPRSFTMYNTDFDLSIMWLDENYNVLHSTIATPCPKWKSVFCPEYTYETPVRYVIELPSNFPSTP